MALPEDAIDIRGVEAQTSRFFRGLASDRFLDPEEKSRMASSFFTDVSQIRKVREQNAMAPYRLAQAKLGLESARFSMDRARKQAEYEDSFMNLNSTVDDQLEGILNDEQLTPEERAQEIRRLEFETQRNVPPTVPGASSWLSKKFGTARAAAGEKPESEISMAQGLGLIGMGVPLEVLESGDTKAIWKEAAIATQRLQQQKQASEQQDEAEKEARAKQAAFDSAISAVTGIDFATDPNNVDAAGNPVLDKTRFKGGDITKVRIKRALARSPDPEARKAMASDDPEVLREAFFRITNPAAPAASPIKLPARP